MYVSHISKVSPKAVIEALQLLPEQHVSTVIHHIGDQEAKFVNDKKWGSGSLVPRLSLHANKKLKGKRRAW